MFYVDNTKFDLIGKWRLLNLKRREPWRFFLPNKPQADALKALGTMVPEKRIFLITSGNGTGKTTFTINAIANLVYPGRNVFRNVKDMASGEVYPGFFDYPFFNNYPANWPTNIWYVSNRDAVKEIWEEFLNWIPKRYMRFSKAGKNHVSEVAFKGTPWRMMFKTVDQDPKTFESANVGIVIFDEPPPLKLYRAAVSRLRKGGIIIIPATPLFSAAWFVDEIIDKIKVDKDKYHQTVSMWDNCIERCSFWDCGEFGLQPKGCLTEENIKFQIRNFDPDEREARENGKFQYLVGLVYKTYSQKNHFVKLKPIRDPKQYVYKFVLDPHERRPPAACWIRIDRWQRSRIIREWPGPLDSEYQGRMFKDIKSADPYVVEDFVRRWCEIEEEMRIPKDRMMSVIDPNFGRKPNSFSGLMLFEEYELLFRKYGRPRQFVTDAIDDLATGHAAVKELLKPKRYGGVVDYPLLIDSGYCPNTDWGMRTYSYEPEPTGKTAEIRDLAIKVREIGKDHPDLLRYHAVTPYKWFPLPEIRDRSFDDYDHQSTPAQRGDGADFA